MSWQDQGWIVQVAHQAATIVVDFFSRRPGPDQCHVGFQSLDLAFYVIHSAKSNDLVTMKTNQVGECASLGVHLFQCQRRFHACGSSSGTKVALVVQSAVNAGDNLEGKCVEVI